MKENLSLEIFINSVPGETRLAVARQGKLADLLIVSAEDICLLGNVYSGVVEKVMVALNAAFINIGYSESGYLDANDAQFFDRDREKPKLINALLKEGDVVSVQVIREPSEGKGPKLTTRLAIGGRGIIVTPGCTGISISRSIIDKKERKRLRGILDEYSQSMFGIIVRTKAQLMSSGLIKKELKGLAEKLGKIEYARKKGRPPVCLYHEVGKIEKYIADYSSDRWRRIIVDDRIMLMQLMKYSLEFIPELEKLFEFASDPVALFTTHDLEQQIDDLFETRVDLASGGKLIIEETSALTAIDVDSGAHKRGGNPEELALGVNKEAAIEVARQLVLRNIAGQIIIDFLPMKRKENRETIKTVLREELYDDNKCNVFGFSNIGLLEMTRQRQGESMASRFLSKTGPVKSIKTIALDAVRSVLRELHRNSGKNVTVVCSPQLYFYLKTDTHMTWKKLLIRTGPIVKLTEEIRLSENQFEILVC